MKVLSFFFALCFSFSLLAAEVYYCPMLCEGQKTYPTKTTCPVCGMYLETKTEGKRPLNTREYRMDLSSDPLQVKAGEKTTLVFTPRKTKDNSILQPLQIVHEKPMHLIMVSQELDWFSHEHPEAQKDGSYRLEFTFPKAGNFVLYSDITPTGDRNQVFPLAIQVQGEKPKETTPMTWKDNTNAVRKVGDYGVSLTLSPQPKSSVPITFEFLITKQGKKVQDLEPYLGAMGHLVILSDDTTQYLHAHPPGHHHEHGVETHPVKKGPVEKAVKFVTSFPRPGFYKAWMQFSHKGKVETADFTILVK